MNKTPKRWLCTWVNLCLVEGASTVWAHGKIQSGFFEVTAHDEADAFENAMRSLSQGTNREVKIQLRIRPVSMLARIFPLKARVFLEDITPVEVEEFENLSIPGLEGLLLKRFAPMSPVRKFITSWVTQWIIP